MATDIKKHTTIASGETPSRAAIAAAILSINDAIPVANQTEQAQLLAALSGTPYAVGPTRPLVTVRQDAPGLHGLEVSFGGAFVPASGMLHFANLADANSWASTNSALLTQGDVARAGTSRIFWTGTAWRDTATITPAGSVTVGGGAFLRWDDGYVEFGVDFAPTTGSWSAATLVTTLPTGFRPVAGVGFSHMSYNGGFANTANVGLIGTDGTVYVNQIAAASQIVARGFVKFKAA